METVATLSEFEALNEQLAALVEAGVPLDVGIGQSTTHVAQEVRKINSTVARRVNRGESLAEAIEDDEDNVPADYRSVVQFGLQTGNLTAGLDDASRIVESDAHARSMLETALVYPLIVCGIAYIGLIVFCTFFVPIFEDMYLDLGLEPNSGLRVMSMVRETLPAWVAVPPILLLAYGAWRLMRRPSPSAVFHRGLFRWLPGMARIRFDERCARFASSLSTLLHNQVSLDEALRTAGDSSGDAGLRRGATAVAEGIRTGLLADDDSELRLGFPPFLRWAIWQSDESTGRVEALQIAARVYRESALRRTERLQAIVPVLALVLIGGTVTLLYGLALFVPLTQFLRVLSV